MIKIVITLTIIYWLMAKVDDAIRDTGSASVTWWGEYSKIYWRDKSWWRFLF